MSGFLRSAATAFVVFMAGATSDALADPPGRVGRLSLIEGDVTFHDTAARESSPATLNWPVTSAAAISTAPGGRAEVRIGSTAVHLDGATALEFVRVDDESVRLRLEYGAVAMRVRSREVADELVLETRDARVSFNGAGRYRVEAGRAPDTTAVTAFQGSAQVDADGVVVAVSPGRRAEVAAGGSARVVNAVADSFDDWTLARDQRDDAGQSTRYVSPETTGYEVARRARRLARDAGLRPGLVSAQCPCGLGALSGRPLGVGRAVGLDVDRRSAVGLRALPLREVGADRRLLGMGSGRGRRAPGVRTGTRRLGRAARLERFHRHRKGARGRLVPARTARGVRTRLPVQHGLRAEREPRACCERQRVRSAAIRAPASRTRGHGRPGLGGVGRPAGRAIGDAFAARGRRRECGGLQRPAGGFRAAAAPVRHPPARRRRAVDAAAAARAAGCRARCERGCTAAARGPDAGAAGWIRDNRSAPRASAVRACRCCARTTSGYRAGTQAR